MCENIHACSKCRQKHEQIGKDGLRLIEIRTCAQARQANVSYDAANLENLHQKGSDDAESDCVECKGETPPTSP